MSKKPKIAIFDFTDCEGCQVKIVSLREKILDIIKAVDIVNWRLGQEQADKGPYDVSFIEGTPITPDEIEVLEYARKNSKYVIGLGSCATLGGIPGIIDKTERKKWYEKIYGKDYKPVGIDAVPISAYVDVDYLIHGCPVQETELERVFEEFLTGKKLSYRGYSVCFECKAAGNRCRIIDGEICLGPITQGGCGAICISGGSPCYGCFGIRKEANVKGLVKALEKIATKKEIERYFTMFLSRTSEYKKIVKRELNNK
ncbi:MAG: NADH:ubiquinone oxidoreductase [bacterium]